MHRTLVVWRRLGKEHGEEAGFRVNPPEIVDKHIQDKVIRFRSADPADWRWWQVDHDVIVERPRIASPSGGFMEETIIYLGWPLIRRGILVPMFCICVMVSGM